MGHSLVAVDEELISNRIHQRIMAAMVVLVLIAGPALWIVYSRATAAGFVIGSGIALLNFYWLGRTVSAMLDRMTATGSKGSPALMVIRFLLRYVLIGAAAYGIFKSTFASIGGLFLGLSLPVGAIFLEAAYQLYGALRHRF